MTLRALVTALLLGAVALPLSAQPALFAPSSAKQSDLTERQAEILHILRSEPGTAEVQIVVADASLLDRADAVQIALPDGREVALQTTAREHRQPSDFSWKAVDPAAAGPGAASAILVSRGGWLTGTVWTDDAVYTVRPMTGGLHVIARQDVSVFRDHDDAYEAFEQREHERLEREAATRQDTPAPEYRGGGTVADVVVPYTSEVAAAYADPVAFAQSAIDASNTSYANTGMAVQLALAYAFETSTAAGTNASTDLSALLNTSDGRFDDAHTYREAYGADLIAMLTASSAQYGGCGIGYLNVNASNAVSHTSYNCAVGNLTFAHEVGHNYGARHDPYVDSSTSPYAYGHGYVNEAGQWRTVMAYNNDCSDDGFNCTRLAYWSDPDVTYTDTVAPISSGPTGDASVRDNARVLDERAMTVAAFRTGGSPPEAEIGPGSIGLELAVGETATEAVSIGNVATSGALPVSWSASIQNQTEPTLAPGTGASPASKTSLPRAVLAPFDGIPHVPTYSAGTTAKALADCSDGDSQGSDTGSTVLSTASGGTEYGQSFTAACTGRIESVRIVIDNVAAPGATWQPTLRLYEGDGTSGTQLYSVNYGAITNGTTGASYIGLPLPTPLDVTAGETYTWFIDLNSGSSAHWINTGNPDSGGSLYTTSDGNPANAAAVSGSDARYTLFLLAPTTPSITWISLSGSTTGSVSTGTSGTVSVAFDATGLATGTYTADLVITTNDPDAASVTIPIAMVVNPAAGTVALGGSVGWRLLSAPSAATVDDLAAMNLVAGVPGYYPTYASATLFTSFDGTNWVASTGAGESLTPGRGFMWYFYDAAYTPVEATTNTSSSVALPVVLTAPNAITTGDVSVTLHDNSARFNALGNPFATPLPLDDLSSWSGGSALGAQGRAFTYDPETASWAFPASSAEPWQGFVVRTRRGTGGQTLTIPEAATLLAERSTPGEASKSLGPALAFELEGTEAESDRVLMDRALTVAFEDGADPGQDDLDMEKLAPMSPAFVSLGVRTGEVLRAYEARPLDATSFEVPLVLQTAGAATDMTLRWSGAPDLPEGWTATLRDLRTGDVIDLREATEYRFTAPPAPTVSIGNRAMPLQTQLSTSSARFSLSIDTGRQPTAAEAVLLSPVTPNPVRESAALSWSLARPQTVSLEVVDLLGRVVQTVREGHTEAGDYTARVNARDLASGVYIVRLRAGDETRIQRLTVVR